VQTDILDLIKDEDIFVAAKFVGGLDNLKQILKNEPEYVTLIDSLKGKLNLIYHSLKEYLEFPMKFEIVGKGENVFKNQLNDIYDMIPKEMVIKDTWGDIKQLDIEYFKFR
jgi:methyltransferase-like protein